METNDAWKKIAAWEKLKAHEVDPRVHGLEGLLNNQYHTATIHIPIQGQFREQTFLSLQHEEKKSLEGPVTFYYGVTKIIVTLFAKETDELKVDMIVEGMFTGKDLESFAKLLLVYRGIEELLVMPGDELINQPASGQLDKAAPNQPSQ